MPERPATAESGVGMKTAGQADVLDAARFQLWPEISRPSWFDCGYSITSSRPHPSRTVERQPFEHRLLCLLAIEAEIVAAGRVEALVSENLFDVTHRTAVEHQR